MIEARWGKASSPTALGGQAWEDDIEFEDGDAMLAWIREHGDPDDGVILDFVDGRWEITVYDAHVE